MEDSQTQEGKVLTLPKRVVGLLAFTAILIATAALILHLGAEDELNFSGFINSNQHQGTKLLVWIAFIVGFLVALHTNPIFPGKSILIRVLGGESSKNFATTERALIVFWVVMATAMFSLWDSQTGMFSVKNYTTVETALEGQRDCQREGLLGRGTYKGGDFYVDGIALGRLERVSEDTYSLYIYANEVKFLLEVVRQKDGARRIGVASPYPGVGFLLCAR